MWNFHKYVDNTYRRLEEAGGDGGEGGGSGGGDNGAGEGGGKTYTEDDIKKLQDSINSLTAKNGELLDESKKAKAAAKQFEELGLEPEQFKNLVNRMQNDEETRLLAEGKVDEVINKRMERANAEYGSKIENLETNLTTATEEADYFRNRVGDMTIDGEIISVFISEEGEKTALEDVKARAKSIWRYEFDKDGRKGALVPRDAEGNLLQGKNGVLTPEEWVDGLREKAPHLFGGSVGAGAKGSQSKAPVSGIDAKIANARAQGNVTELRRLQKLKAKQEAGEA